ARLQGHAAARARARLVGAHPRAHRADVLDGGPWWRMRGLGVGFERSSAQVAVRIGAELLRTVRTAEVVGGPFVGKRSRRRGRIDRHSAHGGGGGWGGGERGERGAGRWGGMIHGGSWTSGPDVILREPGGIRAAPILRGSGAAGGTLSDRGEPGASEAVRLMSFDDRD